MEPFGRSHNAADDAENLRRILKELCKLGRLRTSDTGAVVAAFPGNVAPEIENIVAARADDHRKEIPSSRRQGKMQDHVRVRS